MRILKPFLTGLLLFIFYSTAVSAPEASDKLTPEEVVAKHLAAIGSTEALQSARSRIAVGSARAISYSNAIPDITGVAQFASDGERVLLAMVFNQLNYPYEKAGYDGHKMTVALLERTGSRSTLGDFLVSQDAIFKEGLIGGALSSAWPLLDMASRKPKLSYAGTETIDGHVVHKLKYNPRRGAGDFHVNLFFDAETFRLILLRQR